MQGNLKVHERLQNTYADCSRTQKYMIRYGTTAVYAIVVFSLMFYLMKTEMNYIYLAIAVYYAISTPVLFYVYKKRLDLRISGEEDWHKYRKNQKFGLICGCAIIAMNVLFFPAFF